ncbi:sorting nexin-7 isoform X1 [Sparus aurata]|uniref:sorting nexin-7 isoform X1 n=1 Tax=Sparus aurata TaxID=8175 RepID=UPI0011C15AA4|nr:sorting nexin-7-like isoform X1 [Sparus aurata]
MPNSPSSMVNQYRLEEDEEEQLDANTKDLFIDVDNPESHVTAIETFIMYRVVTKTTRSEFDSSEYEVWRRYQDFLWLRSRLEENHPTLIVHPLPEKFVMKGMVERFNDDFIETRRKALHRFLNKISAHPILSYNQHLKVFLTAQELSSHRKQGPGFLSRMGETVRAVANSVRGLRSRPEEFTLMQEYVEDFSNKICSVDKVTQRIIKEQREYVDELKQYSPTYTQWAGSEEELAESLNGVANCLVRCSKETEEQIYHLSEVLVPTLHEYVLCAETLKAVMRRRDNIQAEFEAKSEALASRKADQDALYRTGTASVSVSAATAAVASAAVHLVPTAAAAFPSMYSALSSAASCCRTFLQALLLLVHSLNKMQALIPARSRCYGRPLLAIFAYRL